MNKMLDDFKQKEFKLKSRISEINEHSRGLPLYMEQQMHIMVNKTALENHLIDVQIIIEYLNKINSKI